MKRNCLLLIPGVALCLSFVSPANAQMGTSFFERPAITKFFHPVVGKGALYTETDKDGKSHSMEMGILGKDSFEGKDGYWMQVYVDDAKKGTVGKILISPKDFELLRMIAQQPGQQAMEMPMNMMGGAHRARVNENLAEWHSVGSESVTVPAGTFSCEHWRNDKSNSDIWFSDKISPFGTVKEVRANGTVQVLTKVLDSVPDRITGPIKKFDMQEMMQEMQQRRQQEKPQR